MGDREAERLWAEALEELRLRMARETFQRWLAGSRVVESGEGRLTIGIEAAYGAEWLERRLRGVIEQAVRQAAGRPVAVSFRACGPGLEEEGTPANWAGQEGIEGERQADGRAAQRLRDGPGREEEEGAPANRAGQEGVEGEGEADGRAAQRPRDGPGRSGGKLSPLDYYIRIKTAFRLRALGELSGTEVKVFLCIALHLDGDGAARPGIETIMKETRLSKSAVCSAIARLVCLGLVSKEPGYHQKTRYTVNGYAWFGPRPAPALWEES